jgi:hypothetical protein
LLIVIAQSVPATEFPLANVKRLFKNAYPSSVANALNTCSRVDCLT